MDTGVDVQRAVEQVEQPGQCHPRPVDRQDAGEVRRRHLRIPGDNGREGPAAGQRGERLRLHGQGKIAGRRRGRMGDAADLPVTVAGQAGVQQFGQLGQAARLRSGHDHDCD